MTDDDKQKILIWLEEKWPKTKRICEICETNKWTLSPNLVTPLPFKKESGVMGGMSLSPQFMIICNHCGNTKYFNAIYTKLLENVEK